ncbi:MAG: type II secretion system protein [Candidatus Omnitrophota bacterium]|jgi:competence protein ComGC|nr:MAG: type II secretion system protein [Candidatus Omnitrophota bacterium]
MYRDNKGLSLIAVMISIAAVSLLLRIAIGQIIKINIAQNEADASNTMKLISAALENYAKNYKDAYPSNLSVLIETTPPYLEKDFTSFESIKGYEYNCDRLDPLGYNCLASPVKCMLSGEKSFTIITGGIISSEDCRRRE